MVTPLLHNVEHSYFSIKKNSSKWVILEVFYFFF